MNKYYPVQPVKVTMDGMWRMIDSDIMEKIESMIMDALNTDGAHHKQWYLYQIAKMLDFDEDTLSDIDSGRP